MRLSPIPDLRHCSATLKLCVRTAGDRVHLIYFGAVSCLAHEAYAYAAMLCLAIGVVGELLGEDEA